jgi:phage terminase large subunit-like protein
MISADLHKLLTEKERRITSNKLKYAFPDENIVLLNGDIIYNRHLYPKHISFLNAGSEYIERAFIAANRVGKTRTGIIEVLTHATGDYEDWWEGKRFEGPVQIWIAGDRGEIIRDSIQKQILELMPQHALIKTTPMSGVPGAYGQYIVRHKSGGQSVIAMKTYNAGREAFEAAAIHFIMLDEECPYDIYVECLLRTATTKGAVILTFTPDSGVTETVMHFLNAKPEDHRFHVMVGWDDIPHMSQETKDMYLQAIPPHMRDCRTKGIPYLGSGAIYPIQEQEYMVSPFEIPHHWPRAYALDVGWNATAVVWGAWDNQNEILYIYSEYKRGKVEPVIHAHAIQTRGHWIPGVVDPASAGSNQKDGTELMRLYSDLGLILFKANNSIEAGIFKVFQGLSTGKIKIFNTCTQIRDEMRIYRRNDKGAVAHHQEDHLCDALRYLVMSGYGVCQTEPKEEWNVENFYSVGERNPVTGY